MNILDFKAKWSGVTLTERSAAQADPEGAHYMFERGVRETGGGSGFADVWYRAHFGWEN